MKQLENISNNPKLLITIIYGILGGLALGILKDYGVSSIRPYSWISLFGYMFLLAYDKNNSLGKSILLTFIASGLISETWAGPNSGTTFSGFLLIVITTYAINAYYVAYQKAGYPFSYPHLFHAVWDTINKLLITLLITITACILVMLTASIFTSVNLKFISDFLTDPATLWTVLYAFSMAGLYIADLSENVIKQLRTLLLNTCKLFLPVLSAITIGYLIMLIFPLILGSRVAFNFTTYQSIALLGILFINGVFQIGETDQPYPAKLTRVVNIFISVMPIINLLSIYTIFTSYDFEYHPILSRGLDATNFMPLMLTLLLLAYSLGYCLVLNRSKKRWMSAIKNANIYLGYLVILITLITNNTLFSNKIFPVKKTERPHQVYVMPSDMLSREKAINDAGIIWVNSQQTAGNLPIIVSYLGNDPVYLCRIKDENGYHAGSVRGGKCIVLINFAAQTKDQYEILIGDTNHINWLAYPAPKTMGDNITLIPLRDKHSKEINICRTIYHNRLFIGETELSGYCEFVDETNHYGISKSNEVMAVRLN